MLRFLRFFSKSKKHDFYIFWVVAHVFSNTAAGDRISHVYRFRCWGPVADNRPVSSGLEHRVPSTISSLLQYAVLHSAPCSQQHPEAGPSAFSEHCRMQDCSLSAKAVQTYGVTENAGVEISVRSKMQREKCSCGNIVQRWKTGNWK